MNPPFRSTLLPLATLFAVCLMGSTDASAEGGIAAAGPCAGAETASLAGPIQKLLSPQDVAAGPGAVGTPGEGRPTPPAFTARDACDLPGACGSFVPAGIAPEMDPPTNPTGPGGPPILPE